MMGDTFLFRLSIVNAGRYGLTGLMMGSEQLRMPGLGQLSACTKKQAYFGRKEGPILLRCFYRRRTHRVSPHEKPHAAQPCGQT